MFSPHGEPCIRILANPKPAVKDFLQMGKMANVKGIGRRLEEARESCGLSLRKAAEEYGKTHGAIGYWESERSEVPADYVAWIAERSGCAAEWLLYGTGPKHTEDPGLSAVKLDLIRWIVAQPTLRALEHHPAALAARRLSESDNGDTEADPEGGTTPNPGPPHSEGERGVGGG